MVEPLFSAFGPRYRLVAVCALAVAATGCARNGSSGIPEEVVRQNILGAAYLGQTKWSEAEAAFRRALELRPDDPLLLTNAAIAVNQQGKIDEAVELLGAAAAADSQYAAAQFNLGLIESRRGNFEQAAEHFAGVVRLDPDDLHTRYYLGTSLSRIGREEEAVESLRAALARDPTHVSGLYALGRLLLQRGEQEEGMTLITRSQEIRSRSGLDEAVGGEYGEQGRYSRAADYPGNVLPAPPAIPLRFEATSRVELQGDAGGMAWTLAPFAEEARATLLIAQQASVLQLFPAGRSAPLATFAGDGSAIGALAAGDVNNDGRIDLAALLVVRTDEGETLTPSLFFQQEQATFAPPPGDPFRGDVESRPQAGVGGSDLTLVDRDHDGDIDLFWCWTAAGGGGGCKLGTNDGEGRFEVRGSEDHGFALGPAAAGLVAVAFSDADNDRDVDLIVAERESLRLFTNQRDGSFDEISQQAGLGPAVGPIHSLAVADLDKDGWMDLVVGREGGVRLLRNSGGRFETPVALVDQAANGPVRGVVFDFDNDGFLDVVTSSSSGLVVLHNRGAGNWVRDGELLKLEGLSPNAAPLAGLDADGDGDLDLAIADPPGVVALLDNQGGNANHWIDLESTGVGDNRFGIGTKVEVLAGALRQKFEITRPLPVHAGLGPRRRVDAARYLWPSGVLQDEIDLESGGPVQVTELDRKGTSCPLLYAWRGGGWQFVTDFLGGCAIGYQQAPGVFSVPDTDEYVRIDGGLSEDGDGRLRLRLNNQLEEVIWFDKVELVLVDHPEGTEVYPDERLMPGPPYPGFELFASADVRPIVSAKGVEDGTDLTARLSGLDRRYVDNFALLDPKGYAELHTVEIDLGPFPPEQRVVLLLDGWIDYADSSANIAAHQAGLQLIPPRLHLADGQGGWIETDGLMGFPAGLPKTMAVELTGLHPSADHRVRIETTMRIYWDRARVMIGGEQTPLHVVRLQPSYAALGFGGYPRPVSPDGHKPFGYDPDDVAVTHSWKAHAGVYTAFGDVTPLLAEIDDRFVTTKHGDQIELAFDAPPPPPTGRARTYLLYADGFGKDMDPNSAASDEVGPIPFHGMPGYPYGADVFPPLREQADGRTGRRVAPSPEGWPGAVPLESRLLGQGDASRAGSSDD